MTHPDDDRRAEAAAVLATAIADDARNYTQGARPDVRGTAVLRARDLRWHREMHPQHGRVDDMARAIRIHRDGHPLLDEVMAALKGRDEG